MCHFSCFYLLVGIQTSKSHMAYEFDDRVISVDIGRHERTSPGRDLDLGTVSGADISKLLFQGFFSKQGRLCTGWVCLCLWRTEESDQVPFLLLVKGCISITQELFKNIQAEAPLETY